MTSNTTTPTPSTGPAPSNLKSDVRKVQAGSIFSRHSFGVVERGLHMDMLSGIENVRVKNLDGKVWGLDSDLVSNEFSFSDQWDVEVSTNRTTIVNVMTAKPYTAMSVTFRTKVDLWDKETKDEFMTRFWDNWPDDGTREAWFKQARDFLKGQERTMQGFHAGEHDAHGRLKFTEILADGKHQPRLIDPRTVEVVVVQRSRYTEK